MTDQGTPTEKNRPFKQTRALIRLALRDGWTQSKIAKACRTQQSIVSAWASGEKLAKEHQLRELLDAYGHLLRRNSFRVYWTPKTDTNENRFFRVEGAIVFQHLLWNMHRDGKAGQLKTKIPTNRLVIHHQGQGQFRAIVQDRWQFTDRDVFKSHNDEAIWSSQITPAMDTSQLIDFIENIASNIMDTYPTDGHTLPYLIRQALLQHGFQVEGIEDYPAFW